jgi:regulator of protease activity HflC (stomatin/prohibitin superfamily)
MRAEIGQMTLDRTLAERAHLNANIVDAINGAAEDWGIRCLRYEIREYNIKLCFAFNLCKLIREIR